MDNPNKIANEIAEPNTTTSAANAIAEEEGSAHSSDNNDDIKAETKAPRSSEEKKLDRILANRRSARKSRERRKKLQEDLEASVFYLTKQNDGLKQENDDLKKQVRLLTSLLHQANSQFPVGSTSNLLGSSGLSQNILGGGSLSQSALTGGSLTQNVLGGGGNLSHLNSQLSMGGTPSAPLGSSINMSNIGMLRAIAGNNMRQAQGPNPSSDIVAALLANPSFRTHSQQEQNPRPTRHQNPRDNGWGTT